MAPPQPQHAPNTMPLNLIARASGIDYATAPPAHVAASASALTTLAREVTADRRRPVTKPLYMQLSHYEHGAFLSTLLYGFNVPKSTGELIPSHPGPYITPGPPSAGLRSPSATRPEDPHIYAIVANHPVSVQLEAALSAIATLIARQELTNSGAVEVSEIDRISRETDQGAINDLTNILRSDGWQHAARALGARARAAGFDLIVSYKSELLEREELNRRTPILRHVYNANPTARGAVDKLATVLSQSMNIIGSGSQAVANFARTILDVASVRTYVAHLARDAFVCGNGYLSIGSVPDEDIRLLPPESTTLVNNTAAIVEAGGIRTLHHNVLHVRGSEQLDSLYGVSALEPFVMLQVNRETMQQTIDFAHSWDRPDVPEKLRAAVQRNLPMALRTMEALDAQAEQLVGGPRTLNVDVPPNLYFPGSERMVPAAEGVALSEPGPPTDSDDAS